MLIIIFSWIYLFVVIFLVGRLFLNDKLLSFLRLDKKFEWYEYFWAGLFFVFGSLQVWSIFLPINIVPILAFSALAFISLIISFRKGLNLPKKINFRFLVILVFGLFILSYYASQQTGAPDTMGYHLNAVKWLSTYSTVPGLANLHSRLGFNTSFFPFAAMSNHLFLQDKVSHVALSFFFAVLFAEISWILFKPGNRNLKIFSLFITTGILAGIVKGGILPSLYYDSVMMVVVFACSLEIIKNDIGSLFVSALLAILVFSVKLSGVSFSILVMLFIFYKIFFVFKEITIKRTLALLFPGIFILVPYITRNAILSGWLFYPLPFLRLNFDWTVPGSFVKSVYSITQAWAKVPGIEYVKYIDSSFWEWFPVWFSRNSNTTELKLLYIGLFVLLILFVKKFIKKSKSIDLSNIYFLTLASLISFVYILFTAPDFRFGGMFISVFFASVLILLFSRFEWNDNLKLMIVIGFLMFTTYLSWPIKIETEPYLKSLRWDQSLPTKNVNGILMPIDDSCGNSELPCTPEENNIRWRIPGNLSKGFAPVR